MILEPVLTNPWVRAIAALAAIALVALLAFLLGQVLVPLFFAFLVAYILDPVVDAFERRRIPRLAAVVTLLIILLLLIIAIPLFLVPNMIEEAEELIRSARHDLRDAWLDTLLAQLPLDELVEALGWAPTPPPSRAGAVDAVLAAQDWDAALAAAAADEATALNGSGYDARAVLAEHFGGFVRNAAVDFLRTHGAAVANASRFAGQTLRDLLHSAGEALLALFLVVGNFALFFVVSVYLLKDYDRIIESAKRLTPPRWRTQFFDIMHRIDLQLRAFLRGQLTVCLFLGVFYAIGMLISGVPFAISLGLFGGLASFVPFLGAILTIGPAVALTLLKYGFDWHVVGAIITFAAAQFLEGNVLTPKVVGDKVGLNPVWVILSIMVFGSAFGFAGLLLAVPLAAALKVLVVEAVAYYKRSALFAGDDSPRSA